MAADSVAFISIGILSPYLLIYLVICKDTPFIRHKQAEKVIFLCRKTYLAAAAVYLSPVRIDFQSWKRNHRLIRQPQIFKSRMAFQNLHDLIKCGDILLLKFNYHYTPDAITFFPPASRSLYLPTFRLLSDPHEFTVGSFLFQ